MLIRDPPRPESCEIMLQGIRLADPGKRVTLDVVNQSGDPLGKLAVVSDPIREVLPSPICENNPHASSGS